MSWDIVIGLEVHVELSTRSKIFCGCPTDFGAAPNTQCCPICIGMPGALPVLNEKVLEYAVKAGLALDCEIQRNNQFDRKHYFYPDLPKAYQNSQLYLPYCKDGHVDLTLSSGETKRIRIRGIHMEEDAGKLIHSPAGDCTYLDYNRGCVPLIEIVSQPDMCSAEEAVAYVSHIKSTLEYLEVSDCQMQEGSLRADVNLSVKPGGSEELGTRTEMKNLNSFRAIERAIAFEAERHIAILEDGGAVKQETRRWDDNKGQSFAMRSKENAQDYRYFPDPDLPPLVVEDAFIERLRANLPEFAAAKAARFVAECGLNPTDAATITADKTIAALFEDTAALAKSAKEVSAWMLGDMMYHMSDRGMDSGALQIKPAAFAAFVGAVTDGQINRTAGKKVFEYVFDGGDDVAGYIAEHGLLQISDDGAIGAAVDKVLAANEKAVAEYREGKTKAFGFLVGQVMKDLQGKGNPGQINAMLKEKLEEV
ncbi:MAG: Asp-tRNA(Asn)/Glu-tRNA(Gln) amidotransferase subunit GatB [Oscillospiraceae bacterium]|nr:Asp-tRNA(Asn)/Glu-tRNA(Gln) amidotransferase subunit GatB [Oscillospiraceae bacterium]